MLMTAIDDLEEKMTKLVRAMKKQRYLMTNQYYRKMYILYRFNMT